MRPYMPLVNSSSYHFANPKSQSPMFKVQSQGPYIFQSILLCDEMRLFAGKWKSIREYFKHFESLVK